MKVAHFSLWAPNRSGLFEYVRDQIKCERAVGIDSIFINCDVKDPSPTRFCEPDGLIAEPWSAALDSDIWVMHRSIPAELLRKLPKKKNVAILHGTSEIMALHEIESRGKDDKFNMHVEFVNTFQKIVTITQYDTDIMLQYDNGRNKIVYINDAIDTDKYSPIGYAWPYTFHPAIVMTGNIRINKNPAHLFWAMPEVVKRIPTARFNIFGINLAEINTWKNMVLKSNAISVAIENFHGQFRELRPFLRGAELSFNINYNGIFSRDSMEAMSCGCSVIAATSEHTPYAYHRHTPSIVEAICRAWDDMCADPEGQIEKNRAYAVKNFSMASATKRFLALYESL